MGMRKIVLTAVVAGALALAGVAAAQAGGGGGGHRNRPGGNAGANNPGNRGMAPNAANPGGPGGQAGRGGRGGQQMTPEQMQQRMEQQRTDRMTKALDITAEQWKALEPKVQKVEALQREVNMLAMGGGMPFGGRGMMGGRGGPGGPNAMGPQTELSKAVEELQATLDNKDSTPEQISAKLKALRDARAQAPAELAKVRAELLQSLTPRQEAQLVLMGILQ